MVELASAREALRHVQKALLTSSTGTDRNELEAERERRRLAVKRLEYRSLSKNDRAKFRAEIRRLKAIQRQDQSLLKTPEEFEEFAGSFSKAAILLESLPPKERTEFVDTKPVRKMSAEEEARRYEEMVEPFARECVRIGIARLAEVLRERFRADGALPEVIIYPETSTRILRYAVKPLLDRFYAAANQELPREAFLKTYRELAKPLVAAEIVRKQKREEDGANQAAVRLRGERLELLRRHKRSTNADEREKLSQEAQALLEEARAAEARADRAKRIHQGVSGKTGERVMDHRLEAIVGGKHDRSVLVIDDVASSGQRTFHLVEGSAKRLGIRSPEYFAFIGMPYGSSLETHIDPSRVSFGVAVGSPADADARGSRVGQYKAFGTRGDAGWIDLHTYGFPFRFGTSQVRDPVSGSRMSIPRKETVSGVRKDQTSWNPLVERSAHADPVLMRAARAQYRAWGEEALNGVPDL